MKYAKMGIALTAAVLLLAGCSSGKTDAGKTAPEAGSDEIREIDVRDSTAGEETNQEKDSRPGQPSETGAVPEGKEGADFASAEGAALCGSYFKAGDFGFRLEVHPGGLEDREKLELVLYEKNRDPLYTELSNSLELKSRFTISYRPETAVYELESESGGADVGLDTLRLHPDIVLELAGTGKAAGMYYPFEGSLRMPEAFERPLNETDLIGLEPEDLKILRNEFYAVYGRIFTTEEMQRYFSSKPWYRGTVKAEDFDESVLGGLFKRNIAFLKEAENSYDSAQAGKLREDYGTLAPAPYRELLPESGEIYVNLASGAAHSEDRGLYYAAEGTISVPITFTLEQYEILQSGGIIELTVDELTGEKKTLQKAQPGQSYGDYLLGEEGQEDYVMAAYQPESGTFRLWADSDDTRFKRVYEGEVYVLKGACEEYRGYFDIQPSNRGEMAGAFRVMDFHEGGAYGPEPYTGNVLVTDEKGYMKALYFFGD